MNSNFQAQKGGELKLWSALICVALLGALVSGCGSSDGEETIAKAEFVEEANAICKKGQKEREAAAGLALSDLGGGKSIDEADTEEVYVDVIVPYLVRMTDELGELDQPDSGAETASAVVESFEEGIEVIEDDPAKVLKGAVDPFKEAREQAQAYGLKACIYV